ncbi:hypothetical protein Tco_1497200 [Tanacetum coccineum]
MAKKVENEKAKIVDKLEEQHVSLIKSGRGKGFMCYGNHVANVPNKLKIDVVPRKTRSLTIAKEAVIGGLANSIRIQESRSERRRTSQLTIDSQTDEAVADMYHKWRQKLKGPTIKVPAVQSLLDLRKGSKASKLENKIEESANETNDADESDMDLSNDNPDGDDDATGGANPEGNPELTRYISGASEVPLVTPVDVLATKTLLRTKFREYDQKLEALTNFNVSEAFKKVVQAKVLTEMKMLLPTHILKAVANYVRPRFNTSVLEVMKNNQISLFTQSSTSTNDLSEMDLNLMLLNRIYESKSNTTHLTNQKLYDTLYESV